MIMGKTFNRQFKLLIVDDNVNTLEVIKRNLTYEGYKVLISSSVQDAMAILETNDINLVITDFKMPKTSGLDMVKHVKENFKDIGIMMITGYPSIEGAVEAVKKGAEEYLVKPFTDSELSSCVQRVLENLVRRRTVQIKESPAKTHGIIAESKEMHRVFGLIEKASATTANVLISGESGTGKELVARAIHYGGDRSAAPFVSVNCTAIPDGLLESELFGHVKGAFTGANDSRAGFFQIADGGTILLDEIGDASLNMQGKLLRVMQSKEIFMVGSSRARKVDVRIVAATHKDLPVLIKKSHFREDLFYRLAVLDIAIPPLNQRGDDVLHLANYFIKKFSEEMNRPTPSFSDNALQALKNYAWPGNVRELENLMQKFAVMIEGDIIDVADLPNSMRFSISQKQWAKRSLAQVEAEHILNVLANEGGNKSRTAEVLGIDRKTLREKIKKIDKTK
jgi:two-component system response regulator HydG